MFSGLVESKTKVLSVKNDAGYARLTLEKPKQFNDLAKGHSIAVNGVCLTLENHSERDMQFTLAAETLHITGWSPEVLSEQEMNVERALKMNDRLHGHIVLGHVDALGQIKSIASQEGGLLLEISFPSAFAPFVTSKGSVTVNGVSLTINEVNNGVFSVCLIPETCEITNLSGLKKNDAVTLEFDYLAKLFFRFFKTMNENTSQRTSL